MKLILTNDDGFDAPGLAALYKAAEGLGERTIVAPRAAHSGCSHQVTTDKPFGVTKSSETLYVVDGTPADCVRVALFHILPGAECILSGINAGGNLGADVFHSGTIAAAREAVLHGRRAIALSHYRKKGMAFDWEQAGRWVAPLLVELLARPATGAFWNVNLPHLESGAPMPEVVYCVVDRSPLPVNFRDEKGLLHYNGNYHERRRTFGTDIDICFGGKIAVSEVRV